jgi:hypothetical protein
MVRPTGGTARSKRAVLPSSQELMNILGTSTFGKGFTGAPVASSKAEYNAITDIMSDKSQSLDYFLFDESGYDYENRAGQDPASSYTRQFEDVTEGIAKATIPGMVGPQSDEDTSPAELTLIPTSTTNPARPRTVAAGYDAEEEKLTVVFRDGTFYNYYEVSENEWKAFKANRSKGAIIYRMLDFKPRGPANDTSASKAARKAYYMFSRSAQIHRGGKEKGQTSTKYKTMGQNNKQKKR